MTNGDVTWIANYIWGIVDDVLRDLYSRGKYRDVILPMTVLRRLDAVLEGTKKAVLGMKETLDQAGVVEQGAALCQESGTGVLQHLEIHVDGLAVARQPPATQGRFRGVSRRGFLRTCRRSSTTSSFETRSGVSATVTRSGRSSRN